MAVNFCGLGSGLVVGGGALVVGGDSFWGWLGGCLHWCWISEKLCWPHPLNWPTVGGGPTLILCETSFAHFWGGGGPPSRILCKVCTNMEGGGAQGANSRGDVSITSLKSITSGQTCWPAVGGGTPEVLSRTEQPSCLNGTVFDSGNQISQK